MLSLSFASPHPQCLEGKKHQRATTMSPPPASPSPIQSPHPEKPYNFGIYIVLLLAIGLVAYCFWLGTVIARVWYYEGRVHGDFQVYDIQPEYQRIPQQGANAALSYPPSSQTTGRHIPTRMIAHARPKLNEEDVDDPQEKKRIMEEKRISRLPAFLQDDCGDASEFPDIPYGIPIKEFNRRFAVDFKTLGLRKVVDDEWLADRHFEIHAAARKRLLDSKLSECIQKKPAGYKEEPSEELLPEIASHLIRRFPRSYSVRDRAGYRHIKNSSTDETFVIRRPYTPEAMEILARLASADFVFFKRDQFTERWQL